MTTQIQRRTLLKLCGAAIAGPQSVTPSTATTTSSESESTSKTTIQKTTTTAYLPDESIIRHTVDFDIPEAVTEFRTAYGSLNYLGFRTIAETTNFERGEVDGLEEFIWTGSENPQVVFEDDLGSLDDSPWGYHTGTTAFTQAVPSGAVDWAEQGTEDVVWGGATYTVDGDGFASPHMAYVGPHETTGETVDETDITVVVPDTAEPSTGASEVLSLLARAQRTFGEIRLSNEQKGVFVLPANHVRPSGNAIGGSIFVSDEAFQRDTIDNVPAHEFAYTIFSRFFDDEVEWLTGALAEYYGTLVSFNHGVEDFESFYESLQVDPEFGDAVLSNEKTVRQTDADYSKGPHVLAALDAEIQRRTDGSAALLNVLRTGAEAHEDNHLDDYENVRELVTTFTEDETMGEWLDEYVKTEALPEIPRDPELFEFGTRFTVAESSFGSQRVEPGDPLDLLARVENRGERAGTAPVELRIGDDAVRTKTVELDTGEAQVLNFEGIETDSLDSGTYTLSVHIDGVERSTAELTVAAPAEFELTGIGREEITVEPGESFSLTVELENVGDGSGTADVELFIGETTTLGGPTVSEELTLESGESGTVEFESVRTSASLELGEQPLRIQVGDAEIEATLNLVEATPTPAPTATPAESATRTDTATETSTDDSGPGFGVGTVLTSIGGAGYLLKRRLTDDAVETGPTDE